MTLVMVGLALATIGLTGCPGSPEQQARNALAAANGAIASAQQSYLTECTTNPNQTVCGSINRAIYAHSAAITAFETYCQFALSGQLPPPETVCTPVKDAIGGLKVSVTNMNRLVDDMKKAIGAKSKAQLPPLLPPVNQGQTIPPQAISLAILGLKLLFDQISKGKVKEVGGEALDAVGNAIDVFAQHQDQPITLGELESLRLHTMWPDPTNTTSGTTTPPGTVAP